MYIQEFNNSTYFFYFYKLFIYLHNKKIQNLYKHKSLNGLDTIRKQGRLN